MNKLAVLLLTAASFAYSQTPTHTDDKVCIDTDSKGVMSAVDCTVQKNQPHKMNSTAKIFLWGGVLVIIIIGAVYCENRIWPGKSKA
jgi:hypothetical protein